MHYLAYLIFYPLLWFISILPFRLLYALSDLVYVLVYHVFGYRKKTVRSNMALALPHLSKKERHLLEKKFYKHLCDMFLEMVKTMSISDEQIQKRFYITNLEEYLNLEKEGKSIAIMCGHYASYEWVVSLHKRVKFDGILIYKKITNPYFDKLVKKIRSRFHAELITTKETIDVMQKNFQEKRLSVYGFAADQSPKAQKAHHWGTFMGVEVPIHTGAEMLAKRFDLNIIFIKIKKVKRGFYEGTFEVLSKDVHAVPDYQITDAFMQRVEQQILEAPQYYLWTHKRWKHKR